MKNLLKKLIYSDSTRQKGEKQTAEIIADELKKADIHTELDIWEGKHANVYAETGKKSGKTVMFACHLDVVPPGDAKWKYPPFEPTEENGRIYGRGSCDMKGGITAAVDTIKEIAKNHPDINGKVIFAATAGEETTSCGAKRFMEKTGKKIKPAGIIIPEPTDFEAITAHRGILWVKIKTKGKTAHGSMPHLGINAVSSMNKVINKLNGFVPKFTKHPDLGDCSLSINTITGGEAINVVPDGCTIGIDIRTLPTQNHKNIMSELEDIINSIKKEDAVFQAETSIEREVPGFQTDVNSNFIRNFCKIMNIEKTKAVGFTTDAPFFADKDTPAVIFGAGNPELCHKPDEYIEFADIKKCSRMYKNFVLDFLG